MKIIVAIKQVIDYRVKVRIKSDGSDIERAHMPLAINPFDEIALEEAIRLKENNLATEVIVVSIGDQTCQEILRAALAMGADRACLIETPHAFEPLNIAKILAVICQQEVEVRLVLLGKQAIDNDCNQTGQMLAGLLNWSQGTFISKLEFLESKLIITREVDAGLERLQLRLPAVLTSDLRLNQPRYISLPNIIRAKSKPLQIIPLETLNIDLTPHQQLISVAEPSARQSGIRVNNLTELLTKLKEEGLLS